MLTPSPSPPRFLQLRDTGSDVTGFQFLIDGAGEPPGPALFALFPTRSPIYRSDDVCGNEENRNIRCVANSRAGAPPASPFVVNLFLGVMRVQCRVDDGNTNGRSISGAAVAA
jgi:hypothetical protein